MEEELLFSNNKNMGFHIVQYSGMWWQRGTVFNSHSALAGISILTTT